jgi:hypothetical protein
LKGGNVFNRGDRVKFSDTVTAYDIHKGAFGTVTHFDGDASDDGDPDGYDSGTDGEEVWVEWDDPTINAGWIDQEELQRL